MRSLATSVLALMLGGASAPAQTRLDLKTQSKSPDFSGSPATFPLQVGAALPANCRTGQLFFMTTASAGQNLFGCVATDSWASQTSDPSLVAGAGLARLQNGNMIVWSADSTMLPYLALDNAFLGNNAFAGRLSTTPAATQTVIATDTIDIGDSVVRPLSSNSAVQLVSAPTILPGDDGQHAYLFNNGNNTITLQDSTHLPGSNLCLSGRENATLAAKAMAHLVYSLAAGCWMQVGASGASAPSGPPPESPSSAGYRREFVAAVCQYAVGTLGANAQAADAPTPDCAIGSKGAVYGVAKFSNSATQRLYFSVDLPATVANVTFGLPWRARAAGGDVVWQVRYLIDAADGSASDDPDLNGSGTTVAATPVTAATAKMLQSNITISPAGAANRRMYFQVIRDPAHASDTFSDATYMPELAKVVVTVQ